MSLSKIQVELNAPKNQYNSFGKYKYRSLEDITDALKPHLKAFNYSLIVSDTIEEIAGRIYVKATANLYDGTMKVIGSATAYAREPLSKKGMDEAQITGATSSYARKYCLNGLFSIDDTKDADSHDNTKITATHRATQDDILTIRGLISQTSTDIDKFLSVYKVKKIDDLDKVQVESAITLLTRKLTKAS